VSDPSAAHVTPADTVDRWPVESSAISWDSGRVIAIRTEQVLSPEGEILTRDFIRHPGAVAVVCLDEDDRMLVVDQYRHPVGHRLIEPPAGLLDVADEDPAVAAARELFEEGHVHAASWWLLTEFATSPGMADEAVRLYLARDVTEVAGADRYVAHGEEASMTVSWIPLDDLVESILAGRLHNPNMVVGALAAWAARERGWRDLREASAPWTFRNRLPGQSSSPGPQEVPLLESDA
jgi:8-oxo-dGTP pyrophosphatase MutT (NUDIX family)